VVTGDSVRILQDFLAPTSRENNRCRWKSAQVRRKTKARDQKKQVARHGTARQRGSKLPGGSHRRRSTDNDLTASLLSSSPTSVDHVIGRRVADATMKPGHEHGEMRGADHAAAESSGFQGQLASPSVNCQIVALRRACLVKGSQKTSEPRSEHTASINA
jgi:hypothetical protein